MKGLLLIRLGKYYVIRVPFSPMELNDSHIATNNIVIHITYIESKLFVRLIQGANDKKKLKSWVHIENETYRVFAEKFPPHL